MRNGLVFFLILVLGLSMIGILYGPLIMAEMSQIQRLLLSTPDDSVIVPLNTDFGLVIPKIGVNTSIMPDVNAHNADEYQKALASGIAHASGSVLPGNAGNVFLFGHSSHSIFEANAANSPFYLLHHLENQDLLILFYQSLEYRYRVKSVQRVEASAINWIYGYQPLERLVLMTCWPPGTDWKRLIVVAERIEM